MKVLRSLFILAGIGLVGFGIYKIVVYPNWGKQAIAMIVLGILAILTAFFAKSRQR